MGLMSGLSSRWILLVALTGAMGYLCWLILAPFFSILLWAAVLVIVFYPLHEQISRRIRRPGLAAALSTALVLATILLPLAGVTTAVVGELQTAAGKLEELLPRLLEHPRLPELTQRFYQLTGSNEADIRSALQQGAARLSNSLVQGTVSVLGSALGFLVNVAFVCFTMFYLFLDGDKFVVVLRDWLPLEPAESDALLLRCREIIYASVYGVVVLAAIQGCLGGAMFWLLGLPSPLLWTLVMVILSTIPMLGTFVVWVPAALWLAITGAWGKAVALVLWGTLVIASSDNLLRPHLVGSRTRMHDLLIFFAVLGGLQAFGMLGILLGPVVLAVGISLLAAFRRT